MLGRNNVRYVTPKNLNSDFIYWKTRVAARIFEELLVKGKEAQATLDEIADNNVKPDTKMQYAKQMYFQLLHNELDKYPEALHHCLSTWKIDRAFHLLHEAPKTAFYNLMLETNLDNIKGELYT